uniref:Thioredoxin domain-containing protein n=1 Tax=Lotharella globosa TaxID=91324 RepID=A0A7S3ZG42_9EUKA|mmetsp:Transcript_15467/g.31378  ORF Transcript_15467/g.31378 Transcript_15467/m.31378 type:complete len:818 (-) Transcript_15467:153-2606(-)
MPRSSPNGFRVRPSSAAGTTGVGVGVLLVSGVLLAIGSPEQNKGVALHTRPAAAFSPRIMGARGITHSPRLNPQQRRRFWGSRATVEDEGEEQIEGINERRIKEQLDNIQGWEPAVVEPPSGKRWSSVAEEIAYWTGVKEGLGEVDDEGISDEDRIRFLQRESVYEKVVDPRILEIQMQSLETHFNLLETNEAYRAEYKERTKVAETDDGKEVVDTVLVTVGGQERMVPKEYLRESIETMQRMQNELEASEDPEALLQQWKEEVGAVEDNDDAASVMARLDIGRSLFAIALDPELEDGASELMPYGYVEGWENDDLDDIVFKAVEAHAVETVKELNKDDRSEYMEDVSNVWRADFYNELQADKDALDEPEFHFEPVDPITDYVNRSKEGIVAPDPIRIMAEANNGMVATHLVKINQDLLEDAEMVKDMEWHRVVEGNEPLAVGQLLPRNIPFYHYNETTGSADKISSLRTFGETTWAIFGLHGAFMPKDEEHLEEITAWTDYYHDNKIEVAIVTSNDAFTLNAWKLARNIDPRIHLISDGDAAFADALHLIQPTLYGDRNRRYSLLLHNQTLLHLAHESPEIIEKTLPGATMQKYKQYVQRTMNMTAQMMMNHYEAAFIQEKREYDHTALSAWRTDEISKDRAELKAAARRGSLSGNIRMQKKPPKEAPIWEDPDEDNSDTKIPHFKDKPKPKVIFKTTFHSERMPDYDPHQDVRGKIKDPFNPLSQFPQPPPRTPTKEREKFNATAARQRKIARAQERRDLENLGFNLDQVRAIQAKKDAAEKKKRDELEQWDVTEAPVDPNKDWIPDQDKDEWDP